MNIPEWLIKRANDGTFRFNVADFSNEFSEILQVFGQDADSIIEDDTQNRYCDLLLARQRDIEYLSSLDLHKVIAKHVRTSCRRAQAEETIESWINLDPKSAKLIELADEVANAIRAAWKVRTPPGRDVPEFSKALSLDKIDKFHLGLEKLIGYPPTHAHFLSLMKLEHDQEPFAGQNGTVHPRIEWNIVMQSETWNILGADCQPTIKIAGRECTEPLEFYVNKAREKFAKADAIGDDVLNEAEVAALRLWTGPMHEKYAQVLRTPQKRSGPYVTTLHAINSGITKLARIWPLPVSRKVYRGYKNLRLQDLKKDSFNCVGGVEKCVLATSEDFNIAVDYSGDGAFILEIEVGQANRGADVSWLSQLPHEREILFNALSNVEFVCSPQQHIVQFKDKGFGKILVYQVCVSANLKSKTLEEFIRMRKDLHLNLVDVLAQEALLTISLRNDSSSHGLIKRLCEQCSQHCDAICNEAIHADVCIFNEGTSEYVRLVKDAIMLKSRSETLIDLALGWFDYGKADPAGVDGLQGWQLEALRVAFKLNERPKVTTVVLEQDRHVNSLFGAKSLSLGAVHRVDTVCSVAKLLSLNPELEALEMEVAGATAEMWESVFNELCPCRPSLRVNGFNLAEYAGSTLQQLDLMNLVDPMATMIAPALLSHTPSALTSLNLYGTPIACGGAESLGRAFTGLQRLKYLDLRSCRIADRGCTGIARTLFALSELEDLKLARNHVGDDGFNILASTIRAHGLTRLKSVDMRFNNTQLPSWQCGARCVMKNHIVFKLSTDANVSCVAWSPGGDQIASGSYDDTIIIWDAKTGEQVSTLRGHTNTVTSVAWRPGGDQIVSGGGAFGGPGEVIIWDAKTGDKISELKGHTNQVTCVAWRPGGDQIASASEDKTIIIWDAKTGEQILTLKPEGYSRAVKSVAWRPESPGHLGGDQIASASGYRTIIIWDAKTGEEISTLKGHTDFVTCVAWRPGGDQIASGSYDNTIIIWDAKTGEQVSTLKGHISAVMSVAWRPGGDQIASGSRDCTIIIWDAKTGEQISTLKGHRRDVTSVAWRPGSPGRPGGDQIVSACYGEGDWKSPEADWKSRSEIIIWDAKTGDQVSTLKGHTAAVTSVAWRPGGDQVASGSKDKAVIIWDAKTREHVSTLKGHTDYVRSVAWSPDGDQMASGSEDKTVIIWDVKTCEQILALKGHRQNVTSVAWQPRGDQIVSGGYGAGSHVYPSQHPGEIIIWDAKTGDLVSVLKGHTMGITNVAWHPGRNQIASGSFDKTIIIWDATTKEKLSTLVGHTLPVTSVAWSPGGNEVASGSYDSTVIIWNAYTGEQIWAFKGHNGRVESLSWSPNGEQIAVSMMIFLQLQHDKAAAPATTTITISDSSSDDDGPTDSTEAGYGLITEASSHGVGRTPGGDHMGSLLQQQHDKAVAAATSTIALSDSSSDDDGPTDSAKPHYGLVITEASSHGVGRTPGGDHMGSSLQLLHDKAVAAATSTIALSDSSSDNDGPTDSAKPHYGLVITEASSHGVGRTPGGDHMGSSLQLLHDKAVAAATSTIALSDSSSDNDGPTDSAKPHYGLVITEASSHGVGRTPGGHQLGSCSNMTVILDGKTGDQVAALKARTSEVTCVAWSPWGDQIASGSDETIIIWDAKAGDHRLRWHQHQEGQPGRAKR